MEEGDLKVVDIEVKKRLVEGDSKLVLNDVKWELREDKSKSVDREEEVSSEHAIEEGTVTSSSNQLTIYSGLLL